MLWAAKFSSYEVHWWKVACISVRRPPTLPADASLGNEICSVNKSVEASLSIQQQPHGCVISMEHWSCFRAEG
ncbi:hypothetical protein PVAP13_3KG439100 [Panicum virgatum]|uniref:Uncharacterized protein n=1 Tax=Panicum virgatum TaxID=38727 RepID=A0A8T0UZI6_PANVG|nr:hypothetical protein PVAP13_3KG439100 [Panicum virgatum]KAG2629797.1 hypothetical protein PVAP13_3KG439100 [Panicum virgatum]KAG2629798.1 hypothetical protein PVAP13_3KG439100 [Panicum virgatum]KAG2629799.1 hypothetical protein PVAP13_3KG439100 [Panicum virgatum]KAG2629800.1 hypothetical protein PVAP13_3KG439100 [Panicum virgatum]